MITKKTISIKYRGQTSREISDFRKSVLAIPGDELFTYPDMQTLLYNVLLGVSPVNRFLKNDPASIERACKKITDHFGVNRATVSSFTIYKSDNTGEKTELPERSYTQKFVETILCLESVPALAYNRLLGEVNADLKKLTELMKWYESQPVILKGEQPKNQEERMVYDFHKRCTQELVTIVDFQLYGIKKQALEESHHLITPLLKSIQSAYKSIFPRPYRFAELYGIYYFDCRQIDLAWHRMDNFPFDIAERLQKLYIEDKAKFYRIYFKQNPVQEHFDKLKHYLSRLPLHQRRESIFNDLIRSFRARRWISFYAVALPQVEGLFSEMCSKIFPNKQPGKSLSDKVRRIRPYYDRSDTYFDYYQYYLPIQRNRFSHTGYDNDFKLKSYDLLVDLTHILSVFHELHNLPVKQQKDSVLSLE